MSHFTFNIADYRPMPDARIRTIRSSSPQGRRQSGIVVVSPGRGVEREPGMGLTEPEVMDIRQLREAPRTRRSIAACVYQRRARVLRFTGAGEPQVAVMFAPEVSGPANSEFGSLDLPPAA